MREGNRLTQIPSSNTHGNKAQPCSGQLQFGQCPYYVHILRPDLRRKWSLVNSKRSKGYFCDFVVSEYDQTLIELTPLNSCLTSLSSSLRTWRCKRFREALGKTLVFGLFMQVLRIRARIRGEACVRFRPNLACFQRSFRIISGDLFCLQSLGNRVSIIRKL